MDPRGVGAWNMHPLSSTEEAIWAMDEDEAGQAGKVRHIECYVRCSMIDD